MSERGGIIGNPFPAAVLETHTGQRLDLAGVDAPAVVYFYPADNTAGCTREAEAFNRLYDQFAEAGVTVVGISVDDEESHARFADACDLRFPLVADRGGELTKRLGVMKDYGEYGLLAARITFLLDRNGIVRRIWDVSDPGTHPQEVLDAARVLARQDGGAGR
jgi:peroxiredoxin Q/BCP